MQRFNERRLENCHEGTPKVPRIQRCEHRIDVVKPIEIRDGPRPWHTRINLRQGPVPETGKGVATMLATPRRKPRAYIILVLYGIITYINCKQCMARPNWMGRELAYDPRVRT